ncbi:hypothetical protein [Streptomyces roseicoloratus]|uniref:Lipoprotein n=1 Tax=Streptomyces roseicoloratus TaxID=2508722 RepID=A0ABY9S2M7_9ACTN|nr:hypothetical protein [Streptomyces roseicoloratus]WMX43591.1 hypothetical protein RGF97_00050 [Streptomyces roseicoloratus]WMX48684.1 hypothetical protein RGF97_33220 [Streptomyces roseicoloratus]
MPVTTLDPQQSGPRRRPWKGPALLGLVCGIVMTGCLVTVLRWPQDEVTYRSAPPPSLIYPDQAPHHLALVRRSTLSGSDTFRLFIGRQPTPAYGHWLDVDAALGRQGVESVQWTRDGVRVRFPKGHEVFVPARAFLYGR